LNVSSPLPPVRSRRDTASSALDSATPSTVTTSFAPSMLTATVCVPPSGRAIVQACGVGSAAAGAVVSVGAVVVASVVVVAVVSVGVVSLGVVEL